MYTERLLPKLSKEMVRRTSAGYRVARNKQKPKHFMPPVQHFTAIAGHYGVVHDVLSNCLTSDAGMTLS